MWALMCLGCWSRLGYVSKDSDIHAAAVLPEVTEKDGDDGKDEVWY